MGQGAGEIDGYDYERDARATGSSADDDGMDRSASGDDVTEETEVIRARIEQTRNEMTHTIDAIQEKLSPDNIKEQAKDMVREATIGRAEDMVNNAGETARGFGSGLMETIRQNPVPAALAGIGLGMLWMKRPQSHSSGNYMLSDDRYYQERFAGGNRYYGNQGYQGDQGRYTGGYSQGSQGYGSQGRGGIGEKVGDVGEKVGDAASNVGEKVGDIVGGAGDTLGNVASGAGERVGEFGNEAQYRAMRAKYSVQEMMWDNPLALGAVALAAGAAIGLAVPETRKEHEMLGQTRDNLMDKAQGAVQETVQKVQRVAEEATDAAKDAAKDAANQQGLSTSGQDQLQA